MAKFEAFNTQEYSDLGIWEPLPEGYYQVAVTENELKAVRNNGQMLVIGFEVLEGDHVGQSFRQNYNIVNKNDITVTIARRGLASLQRACGLGDGPLDDADVFIGRPFWVKLGIQASADPKYGPSNQIINYLSEEQYAELQQAQDGDDVAAAVAPTPAPARPAPAKPVPVRAAPVAPVAPVAPPAKPVPAAGKPKAWMR